MLERMLGNIRAIASNEKYSDSNENANKDSGVLPTQRDLIAGEVSKYLALEEILPKDIANAHKEGLIHFHDLTYSPLGAHTNCCLVDLEGMLKNGFCLGNAEIESPKSITTAAAITAQIIAQVSSHQYGGTTINRIDEVLAPYVELSYQKHLNIALGYDASDIDGYAEDMTQKEVYDAFQALEYEINTLHTANGQTPFVTLGFGLGESKFSRWIQEAILEVRLLGLGKYHKTAIFPKLVFTLKRGLNLEKGSPNYDIKQLAIKCTSKRIYPDILCYDRVVDATGNFKAPMGCVDGDEVITYKIKGKLFCDSFSDFWERLGKANTKHHGISEYIKTENVEIMDVNGEFTKVMGAIRNPDKGDWKLVKFSNGRSLVCTSDHPLPVVGKGRTFVDDIAVGDVVNAMYTSNIISNQSSNKDIAWLHGMLVCDASFIDNIRVSIELDERDIGDDILRILKEVYPHLSHGYIEQDRGVKGKYLDILTKGVGVGKVCKELQSVFRGAKKSDRRVPEYIFESDDDTKKAFMAGVVDADGYIHSNGIMQLGSTNKVFALQQLHLLQSLGIPCKLYLNKYSRDHSNYRYRIECKICHELVKYMRSTKKVTNANFEYRDISYNKGCSVVSIEDLGFTGRYSYDVTTESDTFVVSGLHSHNCRSFLGSWEDSQGNSVIDGRNNLGVVSLNLPRIAIESEGDLDLFNSKLDQSLNIAKKALDFRISRLEGVKASIAPILYTEGAFGVRLNPDDNIIDIFKNGRASISLGYIGLHEMANAMFGTEEHTFYSEEKKDFILKVMKKLSQTVQEWKDSTGWGYSLYGTPSESLCDRFCTIDKEHFGVIEGVTDKGYYTNSFHLDVQKEVDPFSKILFEKDFPQLSSGGHICYGEFPSLAHNLQAIEDVWDFAYNHVPYYGTNVPVDACYKCSYEGEFSCTPKGFKCPNCGNMDPKTVSVTRRVCGYLGSPESRPFNAGKQEEVSKRVKHM